jgi:uncharacterized protein
MPAITINQITNANVYMNGESQLGKAAEITTPDLTSKEQEHKALGMQGVWKLSAGFEEMSGKIKWNSIYDDVAIHTVNTKAPVQLQVRCNIERHSAGGLLEEFPMVTFMTVRFKKSPFGMFKQHENTEIETEFTCTAMKQVIDGRVVIDIDFGTNKYIVNGVDLNAQYNEALGI